MKKYAIDLKDGDLIRINGMWFPIVFDALVIPYSEFCYVYVYIPGLFYNKQVMKFHIKEELEVHLRET